MSQQHFTTPPSILARQKDGVAPKKQTREEYRQQKELEELRKAGSAPAEVDEEGKDINPHIPKYMTDVPWYVTYDHTRPTLKHQRVHPEKTKSFTGDFSEMIKLAITPIVLVFIVSAFIYVMIEQSIMSWLPTFNKKVFNFSIILSIQMSSILAASTAVGRFIAGVVLRKIQWLVFLLICLVSAGALLFLAISNMPSTPTGNSIGSWAQAPFVAFILPLIGVLIAPIYPAINSVILSTLPVKKHGLMSGLIIVFSAVGGTTGSILTGHIFQAYGGKTAFYFVMLPMAVLVVCLFLFKRLQTKFKQSAAV